ncbi:hypothetical protein SynSYN20_01919 [Synechococcus sp. SYN20]|uniref:hypothetical protein n=1 Tax=Synechococcus sp. SYN20 TaxID=1050714 RepID=UPI00185F8436|nr:hypothetical protein [Synechococcus sp. SYN20]QNJ26242.1 hypothetical protein SynSYN20_01919 [Synechococcus sp. SYN20]
MESPLNWRFHTLGFDGFSLRKLLSLVAATFLLTATPSIATPALDGIEIKLRGEAQGWLNATCTYYGLGWLQPDQGRQALKRLMLLIAAHQIGNLEVDDVKAAALARDPGCEAIWPEAFYEGD